MKKITNTDILNRVSMHELWLKSNCKLGERLYLSCHFISGMNFKGRDLSRAILANSEIQSSTFEGANLTDVDFDGTRFKNVNLRGAVFDWESVLKKLGPSQSIELDRSLVKEICDDYLYDLGVEKFEWE